MEEASNPLEDPQGRDVFEKRDSEDGPQPPKAKNSAAEAETFPDGFDELPIELISLTDR